jgi:tetratricopeptide (TPR) repeat protein
MNCYDKTIERNSNYADAFLNKGSILDRLGEYDKAIECYDKTIEINPVDPSAYYARAKAMVKNVTSKNP